MAVKIFFEVQEPHILEIPDGQNVIPSDEDYLVQDAQDCIIAVIPRRHIIAVTIDRAATADEGKHG